MAQPNDIQRTFNAQSDQQVQNTKHNKSTSKAQTSSTFQQLLQREGSKWSHISVEKLKKKNNQEHNRDHHKKKSVIEKVKEKAKKLKRSLSTKKHHHENDPPSTSVTCNSITPSDDKKDNDPKFHNARMPESKHIPDTNKQAARDHPREAPKPIPENHTSKDEPSCSSNTIKDVDSKNGAPPTTSLESANTDAKHQAPSVVAADTNADNQATTSATTDVSKEHDLPESSSRFSNLKVSTSGKGDRNIEEGDNTKGESHTRDKGVSVKEYLMHKFEPGEDERALSQIITQTISPRRDKVREAMNAFLKNEEPSESTSKASNSGMNSSDVDKDPNANLKSKSLPASVNTESKIASIVQSHSLGSNASKNLNKTFKSIVASYQNNLNSPLKSSSSASGHASDDNEMQAPAQIRTDANGTSNEGSSPAIKSQVPASRNLPGVVEEENEGKILQAK